MNHEAELAQLLIQMGSDRGVDIETILTELSWAQFPSFVDAEAVRASLLDAVESWWRADLESRIDQLRNQYVNPGSGQPQFGASQVYDPAFSYQQSAPAEAARSYQQAAPIEPTPVEEPAPEPIFEPEPMPEPAPPAVFDSLAPAGPAVEAHSVAQTAPPIDSAPATSMPVPEPVDDATIEGLAVDAPEAPKPPESMPSDATMIWNTRGG